MKKSRKQRNQIKIVKNKEILIYKNGKKYKHFRRTETKKLNENEMYILDYLLNKYMGNEVESDNSENYEYNDNNEYEFELNSNEDFSKSKKIKQSYDDENENEELEDEERIEESNNIRKSKNAKNKKKKKSKQLYDEEEEGDENENENEKNETNIINYSKKSKKSKKTEKSEESNEEEEIENGEEEESLETNKKKRKKGKKSKISKKMKDLEDEDDDEDDNDVEEKKIRKRIITRSKEPNNKVNKKSVTKIYNGDVVEIKHLKKETKTVKTKKVPNKEKKKKKEEIYEDEEESIDNNNEEEEEKRIYKYKKKEYIPQYITQLQSYTSPTIKFINEEKAEKAVLNGILASLFIYGKEIKGIIFYSKNNILCFISSEGDDIEVNIILDDIKKIYFNIRGSANIMNYEKKSDERFIQLVEINNKINDIKLNNEEDYEYLIKGLIQIFKNKTSGVDKNLIYQIVRRSVNKNPFNSESITQIQKTSMTNRNEIIDNNETNNNYINNNYNNYNNIKNIEQNYYNKEEEYNEINNIENNEDNYNYNNIENKKANEDDDIIITTTITEVFKDGELINKETRDKIDGVTKSLHVFSPDKDEYEIFLKNTKLGQTQMIKRMTDGLPVEENNNNINNSNYNINNIDNENEVIIHNEEEDC